MKNHNEMTLAECCEEMKVPHCDCCDDHVTLDSIAACMPEGWAWEAGHYRKDQCVLAEAWRPNAHLATCIEASADTEILARARLAVACHRAIRTTHGGK